MKRLEDYLRNKRRTVENNPCLLVGSSYTKLCRNCDGYKEKCKNKVYDTMIEGVQLYYD